MKIIATVDELILAAPNLSKAVSILIANASDETLKKWDRFREQEITVKQ